MKCQGFTSFFFFFFKHLVFLASDVKIIVRREDFLAQQFDFQFQVGFKILGVTALECAKVVERFQISSIAR